ncbi:MAG: RNA polymerase sigma factor [Bacteroidota bacterium]|jgi:RNA polymerase sigma-70 factor (ECF subfamily)
MLNSNEHILEIILKCSEGDAKAQEWLFKTYYSKLMTICLRYTDNEDDAKDIFNEGFLKIFQNINQFNHLGSFEGWLKRIMSHSAIDFIRRNLKHKNAQSIHLITDYPDPSSYNDAISSLSEKELLLLIQKLPPMSRSVFNLAIFEDYSHKEISKILNIKEGTSMWHLNNARTILKKQISLITKQEEAIYG